MKQGQIFFIRMTFLQSFSEIDLVEQYIIDFCVFTVII